MPTTGHPRTRPTAARRKLTAIPGGKTPVTRAAPEKFDAKQVLKTTGFRLGDEARQARTDLSGAGSTLSRIGAGDAIGDVSNFALAIIGGILGLIMIDLLLSPRGSTLTSAVLKWSGSGLSRLVSPTDPLVLRATSSTTSAPAADPRGGVPAGADVNPATNPKAKGPVKPAAPWGNPGALAPSTPPTAKTGKPGAGG